MDFRILGPLEVSDRGRLVAVGGKPRALLGMLIVHRNELVSSERLIEGLWGERPPETAQAALQMHVSQLRKALGQERIHTRRPGYVLRLEPDELDAARFEALLAERRTAEALALWRGPALADFAYEAWAQSEIARLEELRASALEERIETDLAAGRHARLLPELEALVREQPLRERFRGQLMRSLYRSGRQAEALEVYRQTRQLLVDELGIEPARELRQLYTQILNQDPAIAAPPSAEEPQPPAPPREERKVVTVLFCDLVGFTARGEQVDPEDLSALLSHYHLRLRAELERRGGTVEKFVGDAVLALFGAPVAHEDDPDRALRAAFAIRDWIAEQEDELQVRIGIATGEALVRLDADATAGEAMAVGDVVNTAARLQQVASPGAIVVGEATYRVTRDRVAYAQLEALQLKGKALPIRAWLARELVMQAGLIGRRPATPFVGRGDDLALLVQSYNRALRESSVQLVTIVGEPGIGKTRLVDEFRSYVRDQPEHVLWRLGRCLAYGDGITFWALGEIVKEHAGILESDTALEAAAKIAAAIDTVAEPAERAWLRATLAPLIGVESRDTIQAEEVFSAWRTFLEDIAARQPLVIVIEDLHWADSALLAFLDHLVDYAADVPLLVVATARPELYERAPDWGGGKRNVTTISLASLTRDDTTRLLAALLARATLPLETQTELLERAGGNPLYAEEFVRMLGDQGFLTTRDGLIEVRGDVEISIPESIQALIAARIDTLAADRKALLHDAAVVGKVFWAGALALIGRKPKESVLASLHELVRKEFIRRARRSTIAGDTEYTFWHVLVRDVAYAEIPRAARARKHVAAAEWIERISGERVTDHAEFLANHYATALELARAAGEREQTGALTDAAIRFGTLAAERAVRLDSAQGERYYRRTLALLPKDDPHRPRLLANAADAGIRAGTPFEQIRSELEEAIAQLQAQGDVIAAANAMRQLSYSGLWQGDDFTLAENALRLLEDEPPGPELALLYAHLANRCVRAGRLEDVAAWVEKALPLLERFGLDDDALEARSRMAVSRCFLGDLSGLDDLRELAREALDPRRSCGTHAAVITLNNLAAAEQWLGAGPAAAAKAGRTAYELALRRGLQRPARWFKAGSAEPLYALGEWDEVLHITEEVADWENAYGRTPIGVMAPPYAALILMQRGELAKAMALVKELLQRARDVDDPEGLLRALAAAATVEAARGELLAAVALVEEFVHLRAPVAKVVVSLAEIARVCAQTRELGPLGRLLESARELGPRLERFVATANAILTEAKGDHGAAESLYAHAERGWQEYACVVERAYALLGLGRCRLALGRSHEAAAPLRDARAIFERLGARPLVAQANELLSTAVARSTV